MPTVRLRKRSISFRLPRIRIERIRNQYTDIELQLLHPSQQLPKSPSAVALNNRHTASRSFRKVVPRFSSQETTFRLQQLQQERMASQGRDIVIEERRSFGIGGAGNIRSSLICHSPRLLIGRANKS